MNVHSLTHLTRAKSNMLAALGLLAMVPVSPMGVRAGAPVRQPRSEVTAGNWTGVWRQLRGEMGNAWQAPLQAFERSAVAFSGCVETSECAHWFLARPPAVRRQATHFEPAAPLLNLTLPQQAMPELLPSVTWSGAAGQRRQLRPSTILRGSQAARDLGWEWERPGQTVASHFVASTKRHGIAKAALPPVKNPNASPRPAGTAFESMPMDFSALVHPDLHPSVALYPWIPQPTLDPLPPQTSPLTQLPASFPVSAAGAAPAVALASPPAAPPPASAAVLAVPVSLHVNTHQSLLVQSPNALTQVSVADNSIAQVTVVSPYQVLVQGKAPGDVSMLLWDAHHRVHPYIVQVGLDPEPLRRALSRLFPQHTPEVTATGDSLVLSGTLPDASEAKRALAVAAGFSTKVVNDLKVNASPDPPEVLLQVRFAEVDRTALSQLGANLISTGKGMVGSTSTGDFGPPSSVVAPLSSVVPPGSSLLGGNGGTFGLSELLNVFLFSRGANLGLTLQALEQKNLVQILAEPNLLAMSGKEASFLAGGEFPFPVVQGEGAINNVTIQFKPFGVNLHFTPTVLSDGTIDLKVAPEVSSLDFSNGLTISGFRVPALSTRKAQTELEIADGQSFVIAGLMDNRLSETLSAIPGLSDIPILGAFFRSHQHNRSRDELMVVVTAHLVQPSAVAPKGPKMPVPFLNPGSFDGQVKG